MSVIVGGAVIHSSDPKSLRDWYAQVLVPDGDGRGEIGEEGHALQLGEQYLLFFSHEDVAGKAKEPARVIMNLVVDDAPAVAARLDGLGAQWVRPLEDGGPGRIGTVADPDGNYLQLLQVIEGAHA